MQQRLHVSFRACAGAACVARTARAQPQARTAQHQRLQAWAWQRGIKHLLLVPVEAVSEQTMARPQHCNAGDLRAVLAQPLEPLLRM